MKLGEMNEQIAASCEMRAKSVLAVQKETFRRLRETIEKGERVIIPGFGIFSTKEKSGKEGKAPTKSIRFKMQTARDEQAESASKAERKAKKQANKKTEGADAKDSDATPESAGRKAKKLAKAQKKAAKPNAGSAVAGAADASSGTEPE